MLLWTKQKTDASLAMKKCHGRYISISRIQNNNYYNLKRGLSTYILMHWKRQNLTQPKLHLSSKYLILCNAGLCILHDRTDQNKTKQNRTEQKFYNKLVHSKPSSQTTI